MAEGDKVIYKESVNDNVFEAVVIMAWPNGLVNLYFADQTGQPRYRLNVPVVTELVNGACVEVQQ